MKCVVFNYFLIVLTFLTCLKFELKFKHTFEIESKIRGTLPLSAKFFHMSSTLASIINLKIFIYTVIYMKTVLIWISFFFLSILGTMVNSILFNLLMENITAI